MSTEEALPPNFAKLDTALRSIGYSFEVAVADVIDNSIDAGAKDVLVRLIIKSDGRLNLAIWDNGHGMSDKILKEAMRFGADVSRDMERLGKFGLGLKLASLSQAKEVSVVTQTDGRLSGRAWLEHGISSGFTSTVFHKGECSTILRDVVPDKSFKASGTLVLWSHLYRVGKYQVTPDEQAQKLMRRLETHLALAFHRFLSGKARTVRITLDIFDEGTGRAGIPITLDSLDPFGYDQSGRRDFPAAMVLDDRYAKQVSVVAHIWPPNSTLPNYKLPGGANSRQGFYFYRNNRLIQGGGWNGMRETEPHSSLARVEIDLASSVDVEVSLDVKKIEIHLPPELENAIRQARTADGLDLKKYMSLADDTYRKRAPTEAELPLIPSLGLPAELTKFLHEELRITKTTKHRDLRIKWKELSRKTFFDIDREGGYLYINRAFRRRLLHGLPGSAADIPVLKCLLFLTLEDALKSERMGSRIREKLDQVNRILVRAVKYERAE